MEPKKLPPVNVDTIAPERLSYCSGLPIKVFRAGNVITEAIMPLQVVVSVNWHRSSITAH